MDEFIKAYIACALWSSTDTIDDEIINLDSKYDEDDISIEAMNTIKDDCTKFFNENKEYFNGNYEQAGHDFWLTRNHHGAGFWDIGRGYDEHGKLLTEKAQEFRELYLYVGDDGKLYLM